MRFINLSVMTLLSLSITGVSAMGRSVGRVQMVDAETLIANLFRIKYPYLKEKPLGVYRGAANDVIAKKTTHYPLSCFPEKHGFPFIPIRTTTLVQTHCHYDNLLP